MIRLELPSPPSVNRYWRVPRALGRPILSSEARAYKLTVGALATAQGAKPIDGPVSVDVTWTRPRKIGDLDGCLKALLDAVQGFAYVNDSQIVELTARRLDGKPSGVVLLVRAIAAVPTG